MNKSEFLDTLREKLTGLPEDEINARLTFYSEMIDDRIEDGVLEETAVCQLGDIDDIINQIISEVPLKKLVKNKIKRHRRLKAWEITLLIAGFPVWLPVGVSLFAVALAVYLSMWAIVISLWACAVAIAASSAGCIGGGIVMASQGYIMQGVIIIGVGIFCAGFAIFAFYGCKMATKGLLLLTKKTAVAIKNLFIKREAE